MPPTEKTTTRALEGPRVLQKSVDEYTGVFLDGYGFPAYKGWVPSTTGAALMHEQFIDLSGYSNDQMTVIPTGATLQDPGYYITTGVSPVTSVFVIDIISQEKLLVDDVEDDWRTTGNVPSMPTSREDFNQIIFGQARWMAPSTNFTFLTGLTPISQGQFGSASPTTVAKLWLYRFLIYGTIDATNDLLTCNATRFVIGATAVKEKDLTFLMRQKRSYELGTGR